MGLQQDKLKKCGHSTLIVNTKLLIFGGYNNNYCTSDIIVVEMD